MTSKARQEEREKEQDAANLAIFKAESLTNADQFPKRKIGPSLAETTADKKSFFDEASPQGTLSADWRCITDNISPLIKKSGVVVDLGGNAGRYAEFLALSRKDISKIYSIEPDKEKYDMAMAEIKRAGLEGRVILINKPVAEALKDIQSQNIKVDAVTSLYRTHMLSDEQNTADMAAVGALTKRTGASFLSIDLHRPKLHSTAELMAKVYPADTASPDFREGYVVGLESALRGDEMSKLLEGNMGKRNWNHSVMNVVGQLQLHVMTGRTAEKGPDPVYPKMSEEYIKVADDMKMGFRMSSLISGASSTTNTLASLAAQFGDAVEALATGRPTKTLTSSPTIKTHQQTNARDF